jgi:N-acetylmuramoyl-L-alanine amidase
MPLFTAHGRCSWFGGPDDTGVSSSEDLAWWETWDQVVADGAEHLFLPQQPPGTTGLARRLDPQVAYIACRWDYDVTPKTMLDGPDAALVSANGKSILCRPADWGPNENTGRVADVSPGVMDYLGITTDDVVDVVYPHKEVSMPKIAMSSGHSVNCWGAVGIINELEENIKVVNRVAEIIKDGGGTCVTFHSTGRTQSEVLNQQTAWHNAQTRDYDVQVHFNAYQATNKPMGTECLYVTASTLAAQIASAQAAAGSFINRGAKYRSDLHFLNTTHQPAVLTEVCFVDSTADVGLYQEHFEEICQALARTLVPELQAPSEPPISELPDVPEIRVVDVQIYAPPGVRVDVSVNQDAEG